jgi:hypothetical protein
MTQPSEAVGGGANDPVIAAEPTIEDRFAALDEAPEEEEAKAPDAAEPELTVDDVQDDAEPQGEADELPPIAPPVSWTGENKEKFAELPRDVQEYIAQRETDREKFVQTKAQEAARTRTAVETEALQAIQQINGTYAEQLKMMVPQIPQRPSHQLQAEDPYAYAEQMDYFEQAVAQHNFVQQQLALVGQRQAQAQQQLVALQNQETQRLLEAEFPEYLDPEQRPNIQQKLAAVAIELGYSEDQLANVDGKDILAMRTVANLKEKADKYDALMKQKMEKVRSAKELPRVSKPGHPVGKGAAANQRYTADRAAMRSGDKDATTRVFSNFI